MTNKKQVAYEVCEVSPYGDCVYETFHTKKDAEEYKENMEGEEIILYIRKVEK